MKVPTQRRLARGGLAKSRRRLIYGQAGVTLLELLIALILATVLAAVVSGYGFAFMRTARDVEMSSRLQRELAFSMEAVVNTLKMATKWEVVEFEGPDRVTYAIYGLDRQGQNEILHATLSLDEQKLTLGARVLSRNMSSLELSRGYRAEICTVSMETAGYQTGFSSADGLSLSADVYMRNRPVVYGLDPSDVTPIRVYDLKVDPAKNSANVSWRSRPDTSGTIFYRQLGATTWRSVSVGTAKSVHNVTIQQGISAGTEYELYLELNATEPARTYRSDILRFKTSN